MHSAIEHRTQHFNQFQPHSGIAFGERVSAQQHHGPGLFLREGLAYSGRVGAYEIDLKLTVLCGLNTNVAEFAHARSNAICKAILLDNFVHHCARSSDLRAGILSYCYFTLLANHMTEIVERQVITVNQERGHWSIPGMPA